MNWVGTLISFGRDDVLEISLGSVAYAHLPVCIGRLQACLGSDMAKTAHAPAGRRGRHLDVYLGLFRRMDQRTLDEVAERQPQ